ncbi:hypothetical protein [Corynebacterium mastitidis]|uniref:hypothetical protein n=1 Tax=Corynebacterium mastitidis TaxID=161890 RepID=UPI0012EADFED|nr:hypothetical protein [Corynebacterium mastitidis]
MTAIVTTVATSFSLAPAASAVDNTWFEGIVKPGETKTEGAPSTGFLRNSSSADSGLHGNPFVRMTCRLGNYTAVGGDSCEVRGDELNNEPASFTYKHMEVNMGGAGQEAPAKAWIGGILDGGMTLFAQNVLDYDPESQRWENGNRRAYINKISNEMIELAITDGIVTASTKTDISTYQEKGIRSVLDDGKERTSLLIFPEDQEVFENSSIENAEVKDNVVSRKGNESRVQNISIKNGENKLEVMLL